MTKLCRAFIVLLIILAPAAIAAQGQVNETVLPNGLKVLIKEVHTAPVFTCQVWYKVGSRNEHTGITGVSHLVEHMMFKGTKRYGPGQFSGTVQAKGGMNNASTWIDFTDYWELLSSDHLELALKLDSDRMANALIDPKEFNSERTVVLSELEGRENDPDMVLYQNVYSTAYRVHPYRWPTIGWTSDVKNVSRDQVYNYYRTYYHPNNATLVIVGDVNTKKTLALVKKYFGNIPAGPKPPVVYTTEPQQHGERRFQLNRPGSAARAMLAYHIPEITHPDVYPLMMLDQILSGGKSSRMYQDMVEAQIATSAWSNAGLSIDPGLFLLGATARDNVTADKLEKALLQEVEKAKTTPPSETEMKRAMNQLESSLVFQNDSVSDQGEQLGEYATIATWQYLDTLLPKIKAVTPADVQRVANKYLTADNRTVGWFVPTGEPSGGAENAAPAGAVQFKKPLDIAPHYKNTDAPVKAPVISKSMPKASTSTTNNVVKPKRVVLKNGMVVIVVENHSNTTVAIKGSLKAGGYFDPANKKGLSSFTAEMLQRGTTSRSALELANITDFVGASMDESSETESARFSAKGLSRNYGLLLDVLSDELRHPSFPQDQINRLKGQMISQLDQEKEDPDQRSQREFNRAIFPEGHPYRPQTIEEEQNSIKTITRDDLIKFHDTYYGPQSAIIVIIGDVKPDEAIAQVEKYFGDWQPTGSPTKLDIPRTALASKSSTVVVPMMDKSQVSVVLGNAGLLSRKDPDFYASTVMNQILGGGAGLDSRLGKRIREQMGLVYYVYSAFDATLGDGPWVTAFGTNPANVDKAVATANDVVTKYIKNGPTQKEFNEAIDYITGVFPVRMETNEGVANILLGAETYGLGMDYIQKYPQNYRAVTIEQVRQAAKKHLHPSVETVVVAGPYQKK